MVDRRTVIENLVVSEILFKYVLCYFTLSDT